MALTASSLIEDVSRYLSDFEEDESYVHWTREDLLSYFRKAVGIIVAVSPQEKFIKRVEFPLVEGTVQHAPDECESKVSVVGIADEDGVIHSRLRRSRLSYYPKLNRPMCKAVIKGTGYEVNSFDYDDADPRTIYVDPPVPKGVDVNMVVTCYAPPTVEGEYTPVDLNSSYETVVFELMLYYAWGVDIEDQSSANRSDAHWKNAMTLLQLTMAQQQVAKQVARR